MALYARHFNRYLYVIIYFNFYKKDIFISYFIYEETGLKKGDLSKSIKPFLSDLEAHTFPAPWDLRECQHPPELADLGLAEGRLYKEGMVQS